MCTSCGNHSCNNCQTTGVSHNWYTTQTCSPCSTTKVCKKSIPAECTFYTGSNLTALGLTSNINLETIFQALNVVLTTSQNTAILNAATQATKNANILLALNDINTRLNALEGGTPNPPYII